MMQSNDVGTDRTHGNAQGTAHGHQDGVVFFVDGEKFNAPDGSLSVREILDLADASPDDSELAERHGNETKKYANLDERLSIKNGEHFTVLHTGPTPLS